MLSLIFVTLLGVALLSPVVALRFAIARWFVPATLAARAEAAGGRELTHPNGRLALAAFE